MIAISSNSHESDLNQALANEIIDGNLEIGTKKQYLNKMKHFYGWLYHNYPESDSTVLRGGRRSADLSKVTDVQLKEFFGHISKKTIISKTRGKSRENLWEAEYLSPVEFQSYEHVSGYKSAIKDQYKKERVEISRDIQAMLKEFFGGYERKIAALKKAGEMSITEGRAPITFKAYKWAALLAIRLGTELGIFAHLFLLLC